MVLSYFFYTEASGETNINSALGNSRHIAAAKIKIRPDFSYLAAIEKKIFVTSNFYL
jgi:hypothetical protein